MLTITVTGNIAKDIFCRRFYEHYTNRNVFLFCRLSKRRFHEKKFNRQNEDPPYTFLKKKEISEELENKEKEKIDRMNIPEKIESTDSFEKENINIEILNKELKDLENRMKKNNVIKKGEELKEKDFFISNLKYPCQKYYKANEEEIKILQKSETQFYLPIECENSTIIRLINIKKKVSSPLFRCVRNSKIGLREKEKKFYFVYSSFLCTFFFLMGVWQYKKVKKKKFLIDYIIQNLNRPVLDIDEIDLPWYTDYVNLKEKIEILNEEFIKWQEENKNTGTFSFYEQWNDFKDKLFSKGFDIAWGVKKRNQAVKPKPTIERIEEKAIDQMKLTVNLYDFSSIFEWIERVRNENMFFSFLRKLIKKKIVITEENLQNIVIEKYKYRKVEISGLLDTSTEFYVGPKSIENKKNEIFYYVICPLYLKNGKVILVNRGLLPHNIIEKKTEKQELPKLVTIRGILDPGELYESSFKKIKNFSNKNKYTDFFFYYEPKELCHYSNLSDFAGASFFILNVYDIVFHEDLRITVDNYSSDKTMETNSTQIHEELKNLQNISLEDFDKESRGRIETLIKHSNETTDEQNDKNMLNNTNYNSRCNSSDSVMSFRYEPYFIHKKKKDYLNFFADENTHFNYACQWFLFSFLFSAISVFKFIQFKRWIY